MLNCIINAADSAGKDNDEAAVAVAEADGITCLDLRVVRRKAFPNAAAADRSVVEQAGQDPNAAAELAVVAALYDGDPTRCPLPVVMPQPVLLWLNKFPLAAG